MAASFCRRSFVNYKNGLFKTQKRTGYVVLIPETPEEVAECNIVSPENLPDFLKLDENTCLQVANKYAQQYDVGAWELDSRLQNKLNNSEKIDVFNEIIEPLEVLTIPFLSAWGITRTMYFANQKKLKPKAFYPLTKRFMEIRNDKFNIKSIYDVCKKGLEDKNTKFTEEQSRILKKFVWEGQVNGIELDSDGKKTLFDIIGKIEKKRRLYEEKWRTSKVTFEQAIVDESVAKQLPLDLLRFSSTNMEQPLQGPWIITLQDAIYNRFLEYCPSRDLRRHVWCAYNQICSKYGDKRSDASLEVEDIRKNRLNFAKVLGFPSYVHLSMKTKMAENIENIQEVLSQLLEPAKYAQEKEVYELEKFAQQNNFNVNIQLWDLPYWSRLHKKEAYGLDDLTLPDYFPLSQVLLGLIALCEQLFGILIEEQPDVVGWHQDVRYFRISDEKTKKTLGGFYLDPYARPGKVIGEENNGWFVSIRPRSTICPSLPLSSLIFSFTPPSEEKPSLLYFREVEILFEKFGQMLQFTLTQMNYSEVSGQANIEWDAVNTSGKFLQFWLMERGTLESISGHYKTNEPIPSQILHNLSHISRHMGGTNLCKEIYLCNLDLELHLKDDTCMYVVDKLWPEHFIFDHLPRDSHPYGFKEIYCDTWGTSFYGNTWSKMLAADIFSAFVEVGLDKHEEILALGKRFRSTFLSSGGGAHPKEVFKRFRGRDPNPKCLLDLLNITQPVFAPELTPASSLV